MTLARVAANFGVALVSILSQHLVLSPSGGTALGSSVPPVCVSSRVSPNILNTWYLLHYHHHPTRAKESLCNKRKLFSLFSSRLVSSLGKF